MEKKFAFDLAKKLLENRSIDTGYVIKDSNRSPYITHDTNEEWEDYVKQMQTDYPDAYNSYYNCPGGEIKEYYNKRWKQTMPPKMASYGSSSRFIYESSRDIPSFQFEKGLPICFPGFGNKEAEASLDGYLPSKAIFVEAKCHEFYSSLSTEFKEKYASFYEYLENATKGRFKFKIDRDKKTPTVSFVWDNTPITQFDLKQVLCHLLGIAKKSLQEKGKERPTLVYLVYKPTDELLQIVESLAKKRTANDIRRCWEKEEKEFNAIDLGVLYYHIVHFLHEEKGIGAGLLDEDIRRIAGKIKFVFCNQYNYKATLLG